MASELSGRMAEFIRSARSETEERRALRGIEVLRRRAEVLKGVPFVKALGKPGINIIAEVKYASPSRGDFGCKMTPEQVAASYGEAGAAAISVITNREFFNGRLEYIRRIAAKVSLPLLRKDFIVDPYQVVEARVAGAATYLLIAACLDQALMMKLIKTGRALGMEPLVEVHDEHEADQALAAGARIIGVNNRNLNDLSVHVSRSFEIAEYLKDEKDLILVAESGLVSRDQFVELRDAGYRGFLVGTALMSAPDPGAKLRELLEEADAN